MADDVLFALADEAGLPRGLARDLARIGAPFASRPFRASTPSFRDFDSDEIGACRRSGIFPAFSITGGTCALNCKHCRAEILKPMIPAGEPAAFAKLLAAGAIAADETTVVVLTGTALKATPRIAELLGVAI